MKGNKILQILDLKCNLLQWHFFELQN